MNVIHITADRIDERPDTPLEGLLAAPDGVVWVDMTGPTDADVAVLRDVFRFHPLAIEDATQREQRPKIDEYGSYIFLTVHVPEASLATGGDVILDEVDIFAGSGYVVTVHAQTMPVLSDARARLQRAPGTMRPFTDFVLYTIVDTCVDTYFPIIDDLDDLLDGIEDRLLAQPTPDTLHQLFTSKQALVHLRRVASPLRDLFNTLTRRDLPFLRPEIQNYFIDVYDHLLRITDMIDTQRDLVAGAMDIYLSAVNNRLNENVQRLTVITAALALAAVVTGLYGMNFDLLYPDVHWRYGFVFALGLIFALWTIMTYIFKRLGWF
ncbi:MAG TPA: magnesium/cobalt transporter CorA [bacterium]|nr:magnesium/cobalt transporter CorA [bacterium]